MVMHARNDLLRSGWSTYQVPGQPGLHKETLSQKEKKKDNIL